MKQFKYIFLGLLTLAAPAMLTSCDEDEVEMADWATDSDKAEQGEWTLVWSDEFDTPTEDNRPDPNKWTYELGHSGFGNEEKQNYTNRVENACYALEDGAGCLKITARDDNYQGVTYSSARLKTEGRFVATYGRFVARMKLPYGIGMWPAFWLLGANANEAENVWPKCGEIDIMENAGKHPNIVSSAMHCPNHSGGNPFTKTFGYPDKRFDADFHIFAVDWSENQITFSVDGRPYHTVYAYQMTEEEWVFDHPFYIIINLAVGGIFGGDPTADTVFPQSLYVDYVRVYQKKGQITPQPPIDTDVSGGINNWENDIDSNVSFE